MNVGAKLRHFDHHCRAQCLKALKLNDDQVDQVLPVTNVQAQFVALTIDPEYYDTIKYVGRPQMTHFVYKIAKDMDPARLQRAVDTVLPRYDCFRTVFVSIVHPVALLCSASSRRRPVLAHALMGVDRFDSILLVQALTPEELHNPPRQLPGFNFDENLMAPFKEIDVGFPPTTELWPGSLQ
ncbi:unnamed protein product [Penicillium viridicatum]